MNQLVKDGDASQNVEGDNEFVSLECVLDAATEVGTKGQEDVKAHKNLMNTIIDHNRDREPDEDATSLTAIRSIPICYKKAIGMIWMARRRHTPDLCQRRYRRALSKALSRLSSANTHRLFYRRGERALAPVLR